MKIVDYERDGDWLAARSKCVTASDGAAILGLSHYKTPLKVYEEKRNGGDSVDIDLFWWGHQMEQPTANFFTRKTGIELVDLGDYAIAYHDENDWLAATLDRVTRDGVPVELKHISNGVSLDAWEASPPLDNEIQLQIQMYVTRSDRGYLVGSGFHHAQLGIVEMKRNDKFLNYAIPLLKKFYDESIVGNLVPTPVSGVDKKIIQSVFGADDGTTVMLGDAELQIINEVEQYRDDVKATIEKKEKLEALLKFRLGASSFGWLPDGTYLTNKTDKRGVRTLRRTRRF